MGFYLLNISVDTTDPKPDHIPEDLTINDQESIVEIIVEQLLGYEDAIKEYDDNDAEDHNKKSNIKIDLINRHRADCLCNQLFAVVKTKTFFDFTSDLPNGFQQLDTPPPKM
ncbi:hypothetical protein [Fulvivirga lutea]|uniref:Uncharacterized protein n=1 Tax=Fulvivirga lutea TaxID=2810512 RepID=A0A974ZZF5_9BACT|nr:hypothetical protein [Fulvivirga lutea]QSE96010.1 hypothetical protein JR347_10310 [Fulvivirga lutea]